MSMVESNVPLLHEVFVTATDEAHELTARMLRALQAQAVGMPPKLALESVTRAFVAMNILCVRPGLATMAIQDSMRNLQEFATVIGSIERPIPAGTVMQ